MTISKKISNIIGGSSFIRKMFEEGAELKAKYGAENVYDFSLGNPNIPPSPSSLPCRTSDFSNDERCYGWNVNPKPEHF